MARVQGYNTRPEVKIRSILHRMGYRFRLHRKDLPGRPDIVLPRYRTVVFVHGCFWHQHPGCPRAARPTTNTEFWNKKLDGNVQRDQRFLLELESLGWRALVIWGCQIKDEPTLQQLLAEFIQL
jgi:DNA mismatch endonuclease, patch repair protein